jgi:hypothetical protein
MGERGVDRTRRFELALHEMNRFDPQGGKVAYCGKLLFEDGSKMSQALRADGLLNAPYRKVGGKWPWFRLETDFVFEGFAQAFLEKEERFLFAADADPDNSGSPRVREAAETG